MRFHATLETHGKTATGIAVPPEVVEALGGGRRPPVRVTIAGHTYRSTVAARGERFLVGVSAENRVAAGVAAERTPTPTQWRTCTSGPVAPLRTSPPGSQ